MLPFFSFHLSVSQVAIQDPKVACMSRAWAKAEA
jgi:hypothetical protein